jgi:MFS family permease
VQEAPVLRPLSVGDIIDRMLRLFRANPVLFLAIAVLPDLVIEVLQRATGLSQTFDINDFSAAFTTPGAANTVPRQFQQAPSGAAIAVVIVAAFVSLIQIGALMEATGRRYLGRSVTVREAYTAGLRAIPALIVLGVVVVFTFIIVFVVFAIVLAVFNSSALTAIAVLVGLLAFFFVLPWAFLSLAVVAPAIVLEHLGPITAIRRSFHLMDRSRLRALGLYVLLLIISVILGAVFGVLFLVSFVSDPTLQTVLQVIASVATSAISGPLLYGAAVILYYDLRVRKEAFDLQLAAEALPREG